MNNKLSIGVGIGVLLIAVGFSFWYVMSQGNTFGNKNVVATVNGEDVTQEQVDQSLERAATQQGVDIATLDEATKQQFTSQIIDSLINQELIKQKIKEANIEVSDEQIDEQIAQVITQFESEEQFESALELEGISMDDFREQVYQSIAIEIYLEQELDLSNVVASQEEIDAVNAQFAEIENFEELSGEFDVVAYATQQKQQQLIQQFVAQLRETAEIELFI